MKQILQLARTDFKLIFRDPTLLAFFVLPLILFGVFIYLLPYLIGRFPAMADYLPLLVAVGVIENTQLFSFITSMIFVDEKESSVSRNYGVIPMSRTSFLVGRFLFPLLFTIGVNVLFLLIQPFYKLGIIEMFLISFLMALIVPLYALCVNIISDNRMQAMVYIKAANMIVLLPFAAFFVPSHFKHIFGILPSHWTLQYTVAIFNQNDSIWFFMVGLVLFTLLILYTAKIFIRKHFE